MRSQHCALRGAQCESFGAPGMTRRGYRQISRGSAVGL